jgi:hypothetical protein
MFYMVRHAACSGKSKFFSVPRPLYTQWQNLSSVNLTKLIRLVQLSLNSSCGLVISANWGGFEQIGANVSKLEQIGANVSKLGDKS